MITKIDLEEPNLVGFKVSGELEKEEMKTVFEDILKELELPEKFSIYMEVENFDGFNLETFSEGVKFSFSHLKDFIKQIKKMAFVCDISLLRKVVTIEYLLIPKIKLKAFKLNESEVAKDWLKI